MDRRNSRPAVVLLVEDDPGDQELTRRALQDGKLKVDLHITEDGVEALKYLRQEDPYTPEKSPRPDLILLDLNMPRVDGRQVLEQLTAHPDFRRIPTVVLTTSQHDEDIVKSYNNGCNSFISKPVEMDKFIEVIQGLQHYWFELVTLPTEVAV